MLDDARFRGDARHLAGVEVESLFQIAISGLPHYVYEPEAFKASVAKLRTRFGGGDGGGDGGGGGGGDGCGSLLPTSLCPAVPVDGLPSYFGSLWSTIVAEEDLDLPTQREVDLDIDIRYVYT